MALNIIEMKSGVIADGFSDIIMPYRSAPTDN